MARIEKISLFPLKEQELFDTLFLEFQLCKPARLRLTQLGSDQKRTMT